MKLVTIVADSAAEAIAEVHRQLGPEAVIVNVRKAPSSVLSRMWKKPQIEVQATLLDPSAAPQKGPKQPAPKKNRPLLDEATPEIRAELLNLLAEAQRKDETISPTPRAPSRPPPSAESFKRPGPPSPDRSAFMVPAGQTGATRLTPGPPNEPLGLAKMLENLGILPLHAQWLVDQVRADQGGERPRNLRDEFQLAQEFLTDFWTQLAVRTRGLGHATRILVGTPGVGKTTCVCKWLTQEILLQNKKARVWRLDGMAANTAEFLSIHGEILGVPVERVWTKEFAGETPELQFVDLPGVAADDPQGIASLAEQIANFQPAQVLLVLNAAYDLTHLLAHARAFASLPLAGLILTHLDEESRWSKFWNLLLGIQLPVLYLSGGQNIPGDFVPASPQSMFDVGVSRESGS